MSKGVKNLKLNLIFLIFIFFAAAIISRLFFLQILRGDFYKALAQGLTVLPEELPAERGEIFLNKGEPLAINKNWPFVFASPPEIGEPDIVAEKLSEIINLPKELILEKISQDKWYVLIKNKLTDEEVEILKRLKFSGIYLDVEKKRYYPQESLASQVVGFLGGEKKGQYGLEEYYDSILRGENGISGDNLILSLDYKIQFIAEQLLAGAKENLKIESGQIIVVEPNSGKILALANFPNFNPNHYEDFAAKGEIEIFQNMTSQKIFEPGSVLKAITFAAALNEEKITPETTYVDEGVVNIGGWPIYNYDGRVYGETPMTEVLEKSINTGAVFVERELGHTSFLDYLERFGLFEKTGLDLREISSENREFKKGYEANFATASFGQGIEMTPIQLIRAYCVIANGGKLVKPYLVEKIIKKDKIIEVQPEVSSELVISQKTAHQLTAMLVNVVEEGFARATQIPGYYIAGKTGTALIPWPSLEEEKSGYSEETWQSFIGWFPAFNPKVLILVKLDKPETKTSEYSAVPIFKQIANYIINYQQIPPDYQE
jgi:cell division protein FtsI/penicillin-binding protein 2